MGRFHSKVSAGGGDQPVSKAILKDKSDSSSTFHHHQRQRTGTAGGKSRPAPLVGKERVQAASRQVSEATPASMAFQNSADGEREGTLRKQQSTLIGMPVMEPEILTKPQLVPAYSPEFTQQHPHPRLDAYAGQDSQSAHSNAQMRNRANLVSDFLDRAASSNQLSSEHLDERTSPHYLVQKPGGAFDEHLLASSRAVRFPSPHEAGSSANEMYEPFLNQPFYPPSRQEEENKSGSGPSGMQSFSPHLLTSNSSQYEQYMYHQHIEDQKSLLLQQQLLVNQMQHEYESLGKRNTTKNTYSSLFLPSGESDEARSNPMGSGRGGGLFRGLDKASFSRAMGHLSPQNFTDNRALFLSPSTAPYSCLTGRVDKNPRSQRNLSRKAPTKPALKTSSRSRQLEQKSDPAFKLRIQHTEQLSEQGSPSAAEGLSECNVREEGKHTMVRKPQAQTKHGLIPPKYNEYGDAYSKDEKLAADAHGYPGSMYGHHPQNQRNQAHSSDSSSSSGTSEECNVSQNTLSPPLHHTRANQPRPDRYGWNHAEMKPEQAHEYEDDAAHQSRHPTHSLITSSAKAIPSVTPFAKQ